MESDDLVMMGARVPSGIKRAYEELAKQQGQKPAQFIRNALINNLSLERVKLLIDDFSYQVENLTHLIEQQTTLQQDNFNRRIEVLESTLSNLIIDNASSEHVDVMLKTLFLLAATHYKNQDSVNDFNKRPVSGQVLFESIHKEAKVQRTKKPTT